MTNAAGTPNRLVAEDLYMLPGDHRRQELVRGVLRVSEPPGLPHGYLQIRLGGRLAAFVDAAHLGIVVSESGFVLQRDPDTVRGPDVAFLQRGRAPLLRDFRGFFEGAPDLVAEIISPDDTASEAAETVEDYLDAGTRLVWVVYPRNGRVVVHTPDRLARLLRDGDTLDGAHVVPGFQLTLAELFAGTA